jgi:hypothetical protein
VWKQHSNSGQLPSVPLALMVHMLQAVCMDSAKHHCILLHN